MFKSKDKIKIFAVQNKHQLYIHDGIFIFITKIRFDKNTLSVLWLKHTIPISYKAKLDKAAAEGTDSKRSSL